jgi:preprotein translocase subunit SecG
MQTVLIVIHLMIVLALVGVVLIQRSEGGGLGIGGGSGFMTARGAANALTRTTAILATLFFLTSLGLGVLARYQEKPTDILQKLPLNSPGEKGLLDSLGGKKTQTTPADTNKTVPATTTDTTAAKPADTTATKPADTTAAKPADTTAKPADTSTTTVQKPAQTK